MYVPLENHIYFGDGDSIDSSPDMHWKKFFKK